VIASSFTPLNGRTVLLVGGVAPETVYLPETSGDEILAEDGWEIRTEEAALRPLPVIPYDYRDKVEALVYKDLRLHFDGNRYCVPPRSLRRSPHHTRARAA